MSQHPPQPPYQLDPYGRSQLPTSGLAVASMVCGIVALVLFCLWYLSILCAIVAVTLGLVAKSRIRRGGLSGNGMATAGIVCGSIALGLVLLLFVGVIAFFAAVGAHGGAGGLHSSSPLLNPPVPH